MVVIQFGLVALLGFKPPQFKAGYHIEEAPSVTKATPPSLSQDRLRNLEAILSPKPVLAWSQKAEVPTLPEGILDPSVILAFTVPSKDSITKAPESKVPGIKAEPDPQPDPAAEPAPEPDAEAAPETAPEPSAPLAEAEQPPEAEAETVVEAEEKAEPPVAEPPVVESPVVESPVVEPPEVELPEVELPADEADDQPEEITQTASLQAVPTIPSLPDVSRSSDPLMIKPVYLQSLPDITKLSASQRKKQFIAFMLPLILRANQELESRHALVMKAVENNDLAKLRQWGELYGYRPTDPTVDDMKQELGRRVAPIPVSIALAQAAVESGWGTSRFAIQGNALFGQWAWNTGAGLRPKEARFDNVVVRSFASLFDSVRAYMHNINSHSAYADFRDQRQRLDGPTDAEAIRQLVNQLDRYSEEGEKYIETLVDVIRVNKLMIYDNAQLSTE